MYQEGWLKKDEYKTAMLTPVKPAGYITFSRRAPYFMDYLTDQLTEIYSPHALSTEGLSIYTTIDTQVQTAAEKALEHGLSRLESSNPSLKRSDPQKQLQGVVIVMQPKTGYIIAMAGGRDYGVSQFNRATQAMRQPGSAFKPFVYLTALDHHTPVSKLSNIPKTYMVDNKPWEPKNFDDNEAFEVTLREAIAKSQNIATINLAYEVGLDRIADTAEAFYLPVTKPPYPAMALGAMETTPLVLARAYCAFAADGLLPFPLTIRDVVDDTGKIIESRHASIKRLISPAKAYMMSDLMKSVVDIGTARSLKYYEVNWPVAGKTGTTNDSRDAWFVGYTPDILALVWVGFDNGDSIQATGAGAAMPIWADLMKMLPQYVSGEWFLVPSGILTKSICMQSGLLANDNCCPETSDEIFLSETALPETCKQHDCSSAFNKIIEGVKKIAPIF
jgi:penicillin-binding protein 1B